MQRPRPGRCFQTGVITSRANAAGRVQPGTLLAVCCFAQHTRPANISVVRSSRCAGAAAVLPGAVHGSAILHQPAFVCQPASPVLACCCLGLVLCWCLLGRERRSVEVYRSDMLTSWVWAWVRQTRCVLCAMAASDKSCPHGLLLSPALPAVTAVRHVTICDMLGDRRPRYSSVLRCRQTLCHTATLDSAICVSD